MIQIKGIDGSTVWVSPSAINAILLVSPLAQQAHCQVILMGANVPVTRLEADTVLNAIAEAEAGK